MSRIGKLPVNLPAGVTVTVSPDNVVSVKGPLGTLSQKVDPSDRSAPPPFDARPVPFVDP